MELGGRGYTVDGNQKSGDSSPVEGWELQSHYLQNFTHPRWLGMGFLKHQQYDEWRGENMAANMGCWGYYLLDVF